MKRAILTLGLCGALFTSGWVTAAPPAATPAPKVAAPAAPAAPMNMGGMAMGTGKGGGEAGGMGCGMMGGGHGMMGGGMCPMMMGGADTKVDVKKVANGVTLTFTSTNAATVARLQKMAEAMRLMHEAMER